MKIIKFVEHKNNCWKVAEVYENNVLIKTINKFFKVDNDFIYEYDCVGGSGTGYRSGDLIWKYSIKDCNFIRESI